MSALLTMDKCTLKFGGLVAVNGFSLELNEGELVGLIGPNGAGKTCIFNLLTGIYKPEPGKIVFKDKTISGLKPYKINQLGVARTFQNIRLFNSLTVLENVRIGFHHYLNHGTGEAVLRTRAYYIEEDSPKGELFNAPSKYRKPGSQATIDYERSLEKKKLGKLRSATIKPLTKKKKKGKAIKKVSSKSK